MFDDGSAETTYIGIGEANITVGERTPQAAFDTICEFYIKEAEQNIKARLGDPNSHKTPEIGENDFADLISGLNTSGVQKTIKDVKLGMTDHQYTDLAIRNPDQLAPGQKNILHGFTYLLTALNNKLQAPRNEKPKYSDSLVGRVLKNLDEKERVRKEALQQQAEKQRQEREKRRKKQRIKDALKRENDAE